MKKRVFMLYCVAIAVAIMTAAYSARTVMTAAQMAAPLRNLPVIVIDAGHGGFDGGAVGVGGVVEKGINLEIAKKLQQFFLVNGFEVVMSREEDKSLEDAGLDSVRKRKNSDIHNRLALAESYPDCVLLSIHQNKYEGSQYFGAQVFYGPKNEESAKMAKIVQKRIVELLQPENTRQEKSCGSSVYLVHNAKMPALLIECGFLSNPEEALKLQDAAYQDKMAFAIFTATVESLGWKLPALETDEMQQPEKTAELTENTAAGDGMGIEKDEENGSNEK